jgi:hypothetical protein
MHQRAKSQPQSNIGSVGGTEVPARTLKPRVFGRFRAPVMSMVN